MAAGNRNIVSASSASAPRGSRRIPSLDGLRAVAVLLVMMAHALSTVPEPLKPSFPWKLWIGNATLGVTIFFVISGYLITRLLRQELESRGGISLRNFYLRRVLRIFPEFYMYILVIALLSLSGVIATAPNSILHAATFLLNYSQFWTPGEQSLYHQYFIFHFWTLALEEQFYLFWPLLLVLCRLARAKQAAILALFLCPLLRVLTYYVWPEARSQTAFILPTAADSMMAGAALALCEGDFKFEGWLAHINLRVTALIAGIFAFLISPILSDRFSGAYDLPIGRTLNIAALTLVLLYVTRNPSGVVGKLLNSRFAVFLGTLSYSLYLWQQLFLTHWNTTWSGLFPVNFVVTLVAALASYYLVGRPFLRIKDRISRSSTC